MSEINRQIWRHNSYLGHAAMMRANLINIIEAETTTNQTKGLARRMLKLVQPLAASRKTRRKTT